MLLDTGATFSSMVNKDMLTKIRKADLPIEMRTNVGTRRIERVAELPGFNGKIWYDEESMANIISFAELAKQHKITYNSDKDAFMVHHGEEGDRVPEERRRIILLPGNRQLQEED